MNVTKEQALELPFEGYMQFPKNLTKLVHFGNLSHTYT